MIAPQFITLRDAYRQYKFSKADKPRTVESYEGALNHWERVTDNPDFRTIDDLLLFGFQQSLLDDSSGENGWKRRVSGI